jgi:hypothetical protein
MIFLDQFHLESQQDAAEYFPADDPDGELCRLQQKSHIFVIDSF